MTRNLAFLAVAILLCGLFQIFVYPQPPSSENKDDEKWIRVQSDDGEFSIEVPSNSGLLFDSEGFYVGVGNHDVQLSNMEMLNAIVGNVLVSFERYESGKEVLNRIYDSDRRRKGVVKITETVLDDVKVRQISSKTDQVSMIRQYFYTKEHIYFLTATSPNGDAREIQRFIESLKIKNGSTSISVEGGVAFSTLPKISPVIDLNPKNETSGLSTSVDNTIRVPPKENHSTELVYAYRPFATYTVFARTNGITGMISLRVTFDANGFISKIVVLKSLPAGLVRQAVLAALRIKYLPQVKDRKFETTTKTVEYSFDIF
jgi:hypothetical protein